MRRLWELLQKGVQNRVARAVELGRSQGEPMTPAASACGLERRYCHPVSPAPLSPGSPAPGPCFVVPEAAAAPRPPHLIPQDPRTPRLLPSPLMLPDAGKKHFLIASWAPGWAGMRLRGLASPPGPELGPQGRPGCWEWAAVDEPADPGWAGEGHTPRVPRLAGGGTCLPDAVSLCQLTCYGCGLAGLASGFLGLGDPLAAPLRTSW